jgi:hypothetical protein
VAVFTLARRGAVRVWVLRSRGASRVRFGSMKTPALPVKSPSCARAGAAQKVIAVSRQVRVERSFGRRRFVCRWLELVLMATLIVSRARPKLNRFRPRERAGRKPFSYA